MSQSVSSPGSSCCKYGRAGCHAFAGPVGGQYSANGTAKACEPRMTESASTSGFPVVSP